MTRLPTSDASARASAVTTAPVRALFLDGDHAVATTDLAVIAQAHADKKHLWIELDARTPEVDALLGETLHIHPLAIEDVWNDVGLPKVEDFDEYVQIIVHGVREEDRAGTDIPLALSELDVLIGRTFVVTHAQDEVVCAVSPVWTEVLRNPRLLKKGPAWIAHAVMDRLVDEYLPLVDRFDTQIEAVEQHIFAAKKKARKKGEPGSMRRILRLRRSLQMLRRTTIYQREILLRLARADFDEIPREAMPFYRDVYDHFARVTELVDSYRELTNGVLEAHFSMQSQQMNEIMKRLTLISTIMLPLTLIAGIYGMNFEHMPEIQSPLGYPIVLGVMGLLDAYLFYRFRKARWL